MVVMLGLGLGLWLSHELMVCCGVRQPDGIWAGSAHRLLAERGVRHSDGIKAGSAQSSSWEWDGVARGSNGGCNVGCGMKGLIVVGASASEVGGVLARCRLLKRCLEMRRSCFI